VCGGTPGISPPSLMPPPDNPTLVLQSLDYVPKSISFKVLQDLPSWMVGSATVQRIERAPTALELFAHGSHDAPGTFEIGNPALKIETANSAELGLQRFIYKAPAYGAPIMTAWSWAGPYLGINVGYSVGKSKTDAAFSDPSGAPLFATGSSDSLNCVIAGFQGGYNRMASGWLMAGIEADIQLSTQNTTPTFICPGALCNSGIGDVAPAAAALDRAQKLDWFATVRGRLGAIVTPDTLMYLTGGLAVAEIKTAGTVAGFSSGFDDNGNPLATAVGLGFYD